MDSLVSFLSSLFHCVRAASSLSLTVEDQDVGLHANHLPATGLPQVIFLCTFS